MVSYRILPVIENKGLGPYRLIRIKDRDMKKFAKCGHFVMVGFPDVIDPFLMRPISFLSVDDESFSLLIKIKGAGTEKLGKVREGGSLKILGPIGNEFKPPENGVLIAGGIGIAPIFYQSEWMKGGVLFYGVKKEKDIILKNEIEKRGFLVYTTSEEKEGTVVDLIKKNLEILNNKKIFICGPESMMRELIGILDYNSKDIYVYIERRMGCGLGGCKSCAVMVKNGYKLVCQDGPIFSAREVIFD